MTEKRSRKYIWLIIPAIFSLVLLAAHFSRQDNTIVGIVALLLIPMLFVRQKFGLWVIRIALIAGSAEWVRSTLKYIEIRKQIDDDWSRLAIILFSVALFTLISALLLFLNKVSKNFD